MKILSTFVLLFVLSFLCESQYAFAQAELFSGVRFPVLLAKAPENVDSLGWLQDSLSDWRILVLLAIVALLMVSKRSAVKTVTVTEIEPELPKRPVEPPVDTSDCFFGADEILDGQRFVAGSDLYCQAESDAKDQVSRCMSRISEILGRQSDAKRAVPAQNVLQNVAEQCDRSFIESLCAPDSFWMKKMFKRYPAPSFLPEYVLQVFPLSKIPDGTSVTNDLPAWTACVIAVCGALLGSILGGFAFSLAGYGPLPASTAVLCCVFGAGAVTFLSFILSKNEACLRILETTISSVFAIDTGLMVIEKFFSLSFYDVLRGRSGNQQFGYLKRVGCYLICFIFIHLLHRRVVFDKEGFQNRLQAFYVQRIAAITTCLSASRHVQVQSDNDWTKKVNDRDEEISRLKAIIAKIQIQQTVLLNTYVLQ